jgi:hypothetical protein
MGCQNRGAGDDMSIEGRKVVSADEECRGSRYLRFEVFTAVTMKNGDFWDVTPCSNRRTLRRNTSSQRASVASYS